MAVMAKSVTFFALVSYLALFAGGERLADEEEEVLSTHTPLNCDVMTGVFGEIEMQACKLLAPGMMALLLSGECDPDMGGKVETEQGKIAGKLGDRVKAFAFSSAVGGVGLDVVADVLGAADVVSGSVDDLVSMATDAGRPDFDYKGEAAMDALATETKNTQLKVLALGILVDMVFFPITWGSATFTAMSVSATVGIPDFVAGQAYDAAKLVPLLSFCRLYQKRCDKKLARQVQEAWNKEAHARMTKNGNDLDTEVIDFG